MSKGKDSEDSRTYQKSVVLQKIGKNRLVVEKVNIHQFNRLYPTINMI